MTSSGSRDMLAAFQVIVAVYVIFEFQGVYACSLANFELPLSLATSLHPKSHWPLLNECCAAGIVSLPTRFGKLVCFQSLPFVFDYLDSGPESSSIEDRRIALVVEPTAAIMRHQVSNLQGRNISAAFINH